MKLFISIVATLFLLPLCDGIASAQTLINGANQTGTVLLNTTNSYTFSANTGDSINVRVGSTGFDCEIQLYGPNGALLKTAGSYEVRDALIAYAATNSGTFTVLVSSFTAGESGTYALHLAQMPEAFIVPAGDEGGPLTNGGDYPGTITLGDLDMWTFTANTGDSINVRLGATGFDGEIQLYGPNGALLKTAGSYEVRDDLIAYVATNSGTFTVLVSSFTADETGTYALYLAQMPEAFIVPAGDEGGPMTNGGDYPGTITLGDLDMYSFTANTGDSINLRIGSTGFDCEIQLYGPNGALLKTAGSYEVRDDLIAYVATNSGTFTVLVSSFTADETGTYALYLAQMPEAFIVPAGDEGGPMTNGGDYPGTITLGDLDMYSFTANTGDSINLRIGSTGFDCEIQLYGPNGALLKTAGSYEVRDALIAYAATNSGTFTVLVSSFTAGESGTYALHLAQMPEAFIVPAGDEGGPLTNGADATGTITLGDQQMWSFTANTGDSINVRLGTTGFDGEIQLYGPNGALLKAAGAYEDDDDLIAYVATNSGTFTVLISSDTLDESGTYALHLAQFPEPFVVPTGDQGGAMAGSASYAGTITLGDEDVFSFTACTGDSINLQLNTTNFDGELQLYGPNGALLKAAGSYEVRDDLIAYTATNCGTFTVLISSFTAGETGTYGLTANGLEDTMRVCFPIISGASLTVNGTGGPTNAGFVLYSTTNIAKPFGLWTPVFTNQFNQFGVFDYTNVYNPAPPQRYFRFVLP